jgi:succinyl-diaminopimelate desuccinylase
MASAPFDLIDQAKRLVRFNTVTWGSNADCAVHAGALMRRMGMQIFYQESRIGETLFLNVAGVAGRGKDPLLLATHLDTVSPGNPALWTKTGKDPFRLTARGGSLYGLGAADTKLDLLCKLLALSKIPAAKLKRPVMVLGTFGEESGLRGAARFCQGDLPKPKMALVGEPSEMALVSRHKGLAVLEVTLRSRGLFRPSSEQWAYEAVFTGQSSHSSTPQLGENALSLSTAFLRDLQRKFGKVVVLAWEGGQGHNMIPASSRLRFCLPDRPKTAFSSNAKRKVKPEKIPAGWYSTFPWEDALDCLETASALFDPLQKTKDKGFDPPHLTWNLTQMTDNKREWSLLFDLRPLPGQNLRTALKNFEGKLWKRFGHPGSDWQFRIERDNPALDLDPKEPLVREVRAALKKARLPVKMAAKAGCSEAGLYARVGIPSVVIGPGRAKGNIHRPNESVSVNQLKQAIRFYQHFLERTCL